MQEVGGARKAASNCWEHSSTKRNVFENVKKLKNTDLIDHLISVQGAVHTQTDLGKIITSDILTSIQQTNANRVE